MCRARVGADVNSIARTIGLDPRIGSQFLQAGLGFGGSCFKKDILSLSYLAETLELPEVADYWRSTIRMNEWQCGRFVKSGEFLFHHSLHDDTLLTSTQSFASSTAVFVARNWPSSAMLSRKTPQTHETPKLPKWSGYYKTRAPWRLPFMIHSAPEKSLKGS
jgi:hypothetical protein